MLMETSEGVKHFVLYHPKTDRASPLLKVENLQESEGWKMDFQTNLLTDV